MCSLAVCDGTSVVVNRGCRAEKGWAAGAHHVRRACAGSKQTWRREPQACISDGLSCAVIVATRLDKAKCFSLDPPDWVTHQRTFDVGARLVHPARRQRPRLCFKPRTRTACRGPLRVRRQTPGTPDKRSRAVAVREQRSRKRERTCARLASLVMTFSECGVDTANDQLSIWRTSHVVHDRRWLLG